VGSTKYLCVVVAGLSLAWAAPAAAECHPEWPVAVHHAGGVGIEAPAGTVTPVPCAVETGYATSESTIAVTKSGALIYSPAHTENSLGRSRDGGATWDLTYPPKMQYTSLWNTVDPYVVTDPATGRVFWVHATGPTRTEPVVVDESPLPYGIPTALAAASGFQVYSSPDDGRTWRTADYQSAPTGDWEKVFVGPPAAAGPKPSGYPSVVYVCANSPFEVSGPGRLCYRSLDGGGTFEQAGYEYPSPSTPDACAALAGNVGMVARDGTIFAAVTCQQGGWVLASRDEAATWTWTQVPGAPPGNGLGGNLQLTIDQADNLYATWQTTDGLFLSVSRDRAKTWGRPMQIAVPGAHKIAIPAPAAGPAGELAVTYYATADPNATKLTAYITQTKDALAAQPVFYSAAVNDPAKPIWHPVDISEGGPRADFVGGTYAPDGTFWAGLVKQLGEAAKREEDIPTTGYVGHLDFDPNGPAAGGAALGETPTPAPSKSAPACVTVRRLVFRIGRVPGGRVVRAVAYVNGRRVASRHGRDLARIRFTRPRGTRLAVRIVTTNDKGGRVVTRRTLRVCGVRGPLKVQHQRH
jgi:hypothetical protein